MNNERLRDLLYNTLVKFCEDEYEKENVLDGLGMSDSEYEELVAEYGEIWYD